MFSADKINKNIRKKLRGEGFPDPKPPVTISIPADHPMAQKLIKLFEFYTTETQLPSGVTIKHRRENMEAVNLVIRELRQIVVDAGGDPSSIDSIHDAPDPLSYLLSNVAPLLGS
jgi:hypothetical protein